MIGNNNSKKIIAYTRIFPTLRNGNKSELSNDAKKDTNKVTLIATYEPDRRMPDRYMQIRFSISSENVDKERLEQVYKGVSFYIEGSTTRWNTNCIFNPYIADSLPKGLIDIARDVFLYVEYR